MEADDDICSSIGVKTAILSVTAPGPCIEEESTKAASLARQCNDYVSGLRDNNPSRFGLFACLPSLLDTEASLNEITYAFDTLHADGVILYTRYGSDNHYLGHLDFKPIWAELSRREAVVLIHPTHAVDTQWVNKSLPQPMFDYPHETGRAAMDLLTSGMLREYPDCKIILSHAGGTLPYLIYRAAGMLPYTPVSIKRSTEDIVTEARNFYFDTAISANAITLAALLEFAKPGHILFGSDFPNAPRQSIEYFTENLASHELTTKRKSDIYNQGALALIPRLRQYYDEQQGSTRRTTTS